MPYIIKSQIKNAQFNSRMKIVCVFQDENLAMFYLNKLIEKDKLRVENDKLVLSTKEQDSGFRNPPLEFFVVYYDFMDSYVRDSPEYMLSSFENVSHNLE
jgi:hypothetical protein